MDDRLDDELKAYVDRWRQPVSVDPALRDRVLAEARDAGAPRGRAPIAGRLLRLAAPIAVLSAAAVVLAMAIGEHRDTTAGRSGVPSGISSAATRSEMSMVQFVIVANGASRVSLVGDFNGWDPKATPLQRASRSGGGVWAATVPLAPGLYHYTYVVDGRRWMADPVAPRSAHDDYAAPSSVLTVMRRGT
jgi:hypothetical protein